MLSGKARGKGKRSGVLSECHFCQQLRAAQKWSKGWRRQGKHSHAFAAHRTQLHGSPHAQGALEHPAALPMWRRLPTAARGAVAAVPRASLHASAAAGGGRWTNQKRDREKHWTRFASKKQKKRRRATLLQRRAEVEAAAEGVMMEVPQAAVDNAVGAWREYGAIAHAMTKLAHAGPTAQAGACASLFPASRPAL